MISQTRPVSRPEGYGGLSALVSDVDALIAGAQQTAETRATQGAHPTPRRLPSRSASGGRMSAKPIGGWVILGVAVVVLASVVWWSDSQVSTPPATAPLSLDEHQAVDVAPSGTTSIVEATPSPPQPVTRPLPTPRPAEGTAEQAPPIGTDRVLSTAQIRYCLSESIRLDAVRDFAMSDEDINRFNSMIEDYNARCGSYRYRPGNLESARRAVEPLAATLRAEGRARFGY